MGRLIRRSVLATLAGCLAALPPGRAAAQAPAGPASAGARLAPTHYQLSIDIDFDEATLAGRARIALRNDGDGPADHVPLLLYRLMDVDSASVDGMNVPFVQRVVRFPEFPQLQVLAATVGLPAPLAPGTTATLEVRYHGYLLGYAETGMSYVRDHIDPAFTILRDDALAFPEVGEPSLDARRRGPRASYDYEAHITVPDSLVVVCAGRLVERTIASGRATYAFRSVKPSWRMDFAIGPYAQLESGPLRVAYLRRDSTGARRVLASARRTLELFTSWFGPLPGKTSLAILEVEDGYGSQSDVAAIIQAAAAFRDSTRDHELYHEVAHLWNPPDNDRPSPRWNEGLSTFLEYLVQERFSGRPIVVANTDRLLDWLRATAPARPQLTRVPLADYGRADLTGYAYSVGAVFFHLLYGVVGAERFRAIVGGYSGRYAASGATTRDLEAFANREAGTDLTPLFEDWIFTTGWWPAIRGGATYDELLRRYRPGN